MEQYQAFADRVVIRPKPTTTEASGLTLMEGDHKQDPWGIVIFVGEGVPLNNIKIDINLTGDHDASELDKVLERIEHIMELQIKGRKMRVQVGDIVHYGQYAGTKQIINGEQVIIIREQDIFGKLIQD